MSINTQDLSETTLTLIHQKSDPLKNVEPSKCTLLGSPVSKRLVQEAVDPSEKNNDKSPYAFASASFRNRRFGKTQNFVQENKPSNFTIYFGKLKFHQKLVWDSRNLRIGNTIYETLVDGISSAKQKKGFQGILEIDFEWSGETHNIVFSLWFSSHSQSFFLATLGKYTSTSYQQDLAHFKEYCSVNNKFRIQLYPIPRHFLVNLSERLAASNISKADVCILEETLIP